MRFHRFHSNALFFCQEQEKVLMTLLIGRGSLGRQRKFRPKPNKLHLLQNKFPCPFRGKQPTWLLYTVFSALFFCTFNPISKGRSIRTIPKLNEATLLCELRTWSPWTERTEQHQTFLLWNKCSSNLSPWMLKDPSNFNALPFVHAFSSKTKSEP